LKEKLMVVEATSTIGGLLLGVLLVVPLVLVVVAIARALINGVRRWRHPDGVEEQTEVAADAPGLVCAGVGALAVLVSVFLPFDQTPPGFTGVQSNTLIQQGGWFLVALAVAVALASYRAATAPSRQWTLLLLGVVILAVCVAIGTQDSLRTIYPVGVDGSPDTTGPSEMANLGIAIYAALVGGALVTHGGVRTVRAPRLDTADVTSSAVATKQCPDCAETVLAAARVCKHCGYRFGPTSVEAE
jgi:hypothetical protein